MGRPLREPREPPRVAVLAHEAGGPGWVPMGSGPAALPVVDPAVGDGDLAAALGGAMAAFIDGGVQAPLSLARRIHRLAPNVQIVIVAENGARRRLERSMLFTPGLGEVWLLPPGEVDLETLGRAASIGRIRENHRRRAPRVARKVEAVRSGPGRTPFLPDRYLATLLELLPDPVLALDEEGAVVFANPPATALLGVEREVRPSGRELRDLVEPADPESWDALLARGRTEVARAEVRSAGPSDRRRVWDVAVGPVRGERPVRAVLLHDVTEQVESREALAERAEELRRLMDHRSRFYTGMSHELRTPINAIIGYVDLILAEVFGEVPPAQREALERITRASRHLLDLVDDTLDLSRVEVGKIQVRPEPLDLPDLARDLRATMQPMAEETGVELRFALDPSCGEGFCTDPRRLRQILVNLLSNAIRYGEGSPVDLRCRIGEDGRLSVEVEDGGPGIPEADRERIYEEFVQLGEWEGGGTGLGLPISRGLARALGGDLRVESEEGRGSLFRLELPPLPEEAPG